MHTSRLALRQSCRSYNAYNPLQALTATFATTAKRAQDGTGSEKFKGSFADYEAIYEQLQSSGPEEQQKRSPIRKVQRDAGLHARQASLEQDIARQAHKKARRDVQPVAETVDASAETVTSPARDEHPATAPKQRKDFAILRFPKENAKKQAGYHFKRLKSPSVASGDGIWAKVDGERQAAKFAAMRTPDGEKYVMHAIAKWVNMLSSGKEAEFDWSNDDGVQRMRTILDYNARSRPPRESLVEKPLLEPWALGRRAVEGMSGLEILDEEIKRFAAWAAPTLAESSARQAIAQQTQDLVTQVMGKKVDGMQTKLFGSEATGLALSSSDLDIRIYSHEQGRGNSYTGLGYAMRTLQERMTNHEEYMLVTMRWSKYPIINAQHRSTGIDIQIVSSPSTDNQAAVTAKYLAELPHLRDLFYVVRTMLGMRDLVDVFNGGTGSYGLFIMLVAALKRSQRSSNPPQTAAEQLLFFLDFYASFPLETRGLAIEPTPKLFKKHPIAALTPAEHQSYIHAASRRGDDVRAGQWAIGVVRPLQPYLLCLQDPADPTNDLGRKSNAIKNLQASCKYVLVGLNRMLDHVKQGKRAEWTRESLLELVVGRCHEVQLERRAKLAGWGGERAELEAMREEERRELEELKAAERKGLEELREAERVELEELRKEEGSLGAQTQSDEDGKKGEPLVASQ
ncbi:hypothetical protein LTR15_003863 [Elasticomyces elasticus]|nr:hypothetical protein LTR15_003863 [Elasticomyces elasticus]